MTPFANLPAAAIEVALGLLLPLILPTLKNDTQAATGLALHMLAEYEPRSVRDLRLATEAIGYSLRSLMILAESIVPGIKTEALDITLKWATSLSRSSHQAQRRLTEFQRATPVTATHPETDHPQTASAEPPQPATRETAAHPEPTNPEPAHPEAARAESPHPTVTTAAAPAASPNPDPDCADVATAEARLASAIRLLNRMRAHHKGAPPPHSSAAQQIQAQQRVVETARMKLEQARRQHTQSAQPAQSAA